MKHLKLPLLALIILCLTTACGWQLRGSSKVSQVLEQVYLSSADEHSAFTTQVRQTLLTNKVVLVDSASAAPLTLHLLDEQIDRRTAAVGTDALTSAYELFINVTYEVRDHLGQQLAPVSTASIARTYNYNADDAASSAREESLVLREMRRDLAGQLIRQVSAVYRDHLQAAEPATDAPAAP